MQQNQQNKKKPQKNDGSGIDKYAKYSGIAFQMIAIILVFVWGGKKLDQKYNDGEQLFIIIFAILGVFIGLYVALKDFIQFRK
jgi:F0F1-type ATP synthase assembly protein I